MRPPIGRGRGVRFSPAAAPGTPAIVMRGTLDATNLRVVGSGASSQLADRLTEKLPAEEPSPPTTKAEATASDAVGFPENFGDPTDLTSTPKAYATKFFNKLTEEEKWNLEQDLLNSMLNNAWGKADVESSEIQNFKKEVGQFCDKLLVKRKVSPSSPQVSRRKLSKS